jgi:hypothetical protein
VLTGLREQISVHLDAGQDSGETPGLLDGLGSQVGWPSGRPAAGGCPGAVEKHHFVCFGGRWEWVPRST